MAPRAASRRADRAKRREPDARGSAQRRHGAVIEYYPQIRAVTCRRGAQRHVFARAGRRARQRPLAAAAPVRYSSYAIDSVLLTAALMLLRAAAAVFANHWLTVKLVLVVVDVGLGTLALKRARTPRGRAICYVAALVVFGVVISIARHHSPLAWLSPA